MIRPGLGRYVLIPALGLAAFVWIVQVLGVDRRSTLFSESGLIELGTAACFLVASGVALRLSFARNEEVPRVYRMLFRAFACAACFVALEEMSYGQHIFKWHGPRFITERSTKHEVNLHNLYGDRLSDTLRHVANITFPLCFIVLPIIGLCRRNQFTPNHWGYYLLPKTELITIVLLAQAMPSLDSVSKWLTGVHMLVRAGELQELFWSIATAMYACVMYRRLRNANRTIVVRFQPLLVDQCELRKAG